MRQEHFNNIQIRFALTDVQMKILKEYLEAAYDISADPVKWFQECDEVKDRPGMEEVLEKAKEAMFDAIIEDEIQENNLAEVNDEKHALSYSTSEADCIDCGGKVLMGVCQTCGEF
jgi:hypothetical protein